MTDTAVPIDAAAGREGGRRPLFVAAILLGSFLLFLVQPMIARMALPRLGGAPAVWNSAMLVYQALLLGGYAYAHALGRLPLRTGAAVHVGLLALAALWLPIGLFASAMPADAEPVLWVPWLLVASIGPLFFAVSAQAPLMQRWYAAGEGARDPYALYAASNIGSFAGLIAYPLLVEPAFALDAQSLVWSIGYAALFALVAVCAWFLPAAGPVAAAAHADAPPTRGRIAHWIALALVPSGLMLATSTLLTTDIVAVPLLWVVPLGLYLLSFSVAFADRRGPAEAITRYAPLVLLLFGGAMISGNQDSPYLNAVMALGALFAVSVALHARMYALRPAPSRLTGFYLAMSVGGALGGVFAALLAPVIFDWTYEYPILLLAAGALVPQAFLLPGIARIWGRTAGARRRRGLILALVVVTVVGAAFANPGGMFGQRAEQMAFLVLCALGVVVVGLRGPYLILLTAALFIVGGYRALETTLRDDGSRTRSYFGVYTIRDYPDVRTLAHGTTLHGIQLKGSRLRERWPTSYYVGNSGVGRAMRLAPELYGAAARIGVVGLGTGTLACYARPGQDWRFYEIDPAVVSIARDSGRFTFLRACAPDARIVLGDARQGLRSEAARSLDLLALDAFSSDAVPMHLMTREAFRTYAHVLAPRGLLLVHVSNRFLDLEPVVANAAASGGWYGASLVYNPTPAEGATAATSVWIALTRDPETLATLMADGAAWQPLRPRPGFTGWTDDYATILPLLRAWQ